jgi:hypothetical protein
MLVSTVENVKELEKNGKTMYLVTIEGENYMVFDKKWKDTTGNVVKYEKIKKGQFTNLDLKEIIGKKENNGYATTSTSQPVESKPKIADNKYTALNATNAAAIAFIRAGVIGTPDEWLQFVKQGITAYEDFLDDEMKPKEPLMDT